jgi:hypothetical protein
VEVAGVDHAGDAEQQALAPLPNLLGSHREPEQWEGATSRTFSSNLFGG